MEAEKYNLNPTMQREAPRPLTRRRGQRAYSNFENFHEVFWGIRREAGDDSSLRGGKRGKKKGEKGKGEEKGRRREKKEGEKGKGEEKRRRRREKKGKRRRGGGRKI